MTIKEAILSYPGLSDTPDNYIAKVLIDRSVPNDGAADYATSESKTVALCAADCYVAVLSSPDFSEGKLSIKQSRSFMRAMAASLYRDNGESSKAGDLVIGRAGAKSKWW